MLTITQEAASVIEQIVSSTETPDSAGLRIASGRQPGHFELAVTVVPGEDDVVIDDWGAPVFLEPQAAAELDDKILDATVEGDGVPHFSITEQDAGL